MKKRMSLKQMAQLMLIIVGAISALFIVLFLFAFIIAIFGNSNSSGDIVKWGIYIMFEQPIVAILLFAAAMYSLYFLNKHF